MQIPEAKLDEFILLYQKRFGVMLGRDQALEKALKLLNFMRVIVGKDWSVKMYKPDKIEK